MLSVENQKGVNAVQRCFVEELKDVIFFVPFFPLHRAFISNSFANTNNIKYTITYKVMYIILL